MPVHQWPGQPWLGGDRHPRTTWWPLTRVFFYGQPGLPLFTLRVLPTPTRRYHGTVLIHRSPPTRATCGYQTGVCTHVGSGPLRARRRLLAARSGTPSPSLRLITRENQEGTTNHGIVTPWYQHACAPFCMGRLEPCSYGRLLCRTRWMEGELHFLLYTRLQPF